MSARESWPIQSQGDANGGRQRMELSSQHAAQRRGRVRRKPPGITGVVVKPPPRGER